ncbi:MAG: Na+/H+ antiporter subunit E [Gammaproteobacteria bacterium]|jgi:multicomponent Na+:H+ antiporter subunit E|nr:Na+/H+ antiporter subunit E [Gammaproteobacteria bacterium]
MSQVLATFSALYLFWLLLSGYFTPFLLAAGVGSAAAAVWLARRLDRAHRGSHPIRLSWLALLTYWPWLALEIVRSALTVSRIVLHPRLPISPTLVRFRPSQTSDVGLVVHANSITLTPGTITVEADRDEFLVHALTREAAEGVLDGAMDRRVRALEGGG